MNNSINLGKERFRLEGSTLADIIIETNEDSNMKIAIKKILVFAKHLERIRYETITLVFINFLSNECAEVSKYLCETCNYYCNHVFNFITEKRYGLDDMYEALTEIRMLLTLIKKDQNSIKGKLMRHKDSKYFENKIVTYHLNYLILAIRYCCIKWDFKYKDLEKEIYKELIDSLEAESNAE